MSKDSSDVREFVVASLIDLTSLDSQQICDCQLLIDERVLDSLQLFEFYLLLEDRYGDVMALATSDDMQSVDKITARILSKAAVQ